MFFDCIYIFKKIHDIIVTYQKQKRKALNNNYSAYVKILIFTFLVYVYLCIEKINTSDTLILLRYISAKSNKKIAEKHPDWLNVE